jgi:hypothetical protein
VTRIYNTTTMQVKQYDLYACSSDGQAHLANSDVVPVMHW